jgi:hypothetical protein
MALFSQEISDTVRRAYPKYTSQVLYPARYKERDFEKYNQCVINADFLSNYEKWKKGINYETNRKIELDGPTHSRLKNTFIINPSMFEELGKIIFDDYMSQTNSMYKKIDKKNKRINQYNLNIDFMKRKIDNLSWNDYIEFEGVNYGVTKVHNGIHRENDCMGKIIRSHCDACKKCLYCNEEYIEIEVSRFHECSECIQDMRPWNMSRSNKGPCTCGHVIVNVCQNCERIQDDKEREIEKRHQIEQEIRDKCYRDEIEKEHQIFTSVWNGTNVMQKLQLHGTEKLQKLARIKCLHGYSKLKKKELIEALYLVTKNSDFPIR